MAEALGRRGGLAVALLAILLATPLRAEEAGPARNRVFGIQRDGFARLTVPDAAGPDWRVETEAGQVVRDFAPAGPDGMLRLPPGGWYRLLRRGGDGAVRQVGQRFAAGILVIVTGQSQADALFSDRAPDYGAYPAEPGDPPPPPVHALLQDCRREPDCGPEGVRWEEAGRYFGARLLLAELSRRLGGQLGGIPVALASAGWGGASAADLADPGTRPGARLRLVARAAAPASAALILGHGTTDALRGTAPEDYIADLARVVAVLREAGAPDMPVLQAPLPRLAGRMEILGRGRPAAWLAPEGEASALARWGLLRFSPLPAETVAGAAAIRAAQAEAARRLGLLPGGDLSGVALLADGIHWNRDGVRKAVSQAAEALALALR